MLKTTQKISGTGIVDEGALEVLLTSLSCKKEDVLFFDIETTGLSPKNSDLYLIGAGYFTDGSWQIDQFFANDSSEAKDVLIAFAGLTRKFLKVVSFNGDKFDIPFLQAKYADHEMLDPFNRLSSVDLYKCVKPYKLQLGIPDCKQKTVELFLGIDRDDRYDGGKLISLYKDYTVSKSETLLKPLLLHNFEDVKGMMRLLPMLYYDRFFKMFKNLPKVSVRTDEDIDEERYMASEEAGLQGELPQLPLRAVKVQANRYRDYEGKEKSEVYMKLRLPYNLPSSLSGNESGCFFKAEGNEATLKVPLYETELKYFYSNYKDYYFLPQEDMAIHKSLAGFVDKDFKEKATPENCYTKKEGQFLQEWDLVFAPFFKRDYQDKCFFFDLNENMKKSRFAMSLYGCHVVAHIMDAE